MLIYGKNVARESINSDTKIIRAYISKKFREEDIIKSLKDKNVKIDFVENVVLDRKIDGLHQGIVLEVSEIDTLRIDEFLNKIKDKNGYKRVVMLDHLEDPHNFGAIIRTCEALGIDGIIIPNDRSVTINATVIKTSVGAINNIDIIRVANLYSSIVKLKDNDFWIVGTDMDGEDYRNIDYKMNTCLVIGNEGKGISKIVRDNCDFIASIPMKGKINSLNASVACAIVVSRIVGDDIGL